MVVRILNTANKILGLPPRLVLSITYLYQNIQVHFDFHVAEHTDLGQGYYLPRRELIAPKHGGKNELYLATLDDASDVISKTRGKYFDKLLECQDFLVNLYWSGR